MDSKRSSSQISWLIPVAVLAVVLVLAAVAAAYFCTPGVSGLSVGKGDVTLVMEDSKTVRLTWPESPDQALTRVSLRPEGEAEFQVWEEVAGNTTTLDASLLERPLTIRIQAIAQGKNLLGMEREMVSSGAIEVTVQPYTAVLSRLDGEGGEVGELSLSWDGGGRYEVGVLEDGQFRPLRQLSGSSAVLRFGEDGDLPLPSYDGSVQVTVRALQSGKGYILYGPCVTPLEVTRELLLGNQLSLECQQIGERLYALRWNETKGDCYEVREWINERWVTLAQVERSDELRYETGFLRSGSDHRYQVVSVGGDPLEPVEPAEVSLRAEISTRYATVWPVIQVELFEDAALSKFMGQVPAGTALCVLEESGDAFHIRYGEKYGWVDSRFCMINLREYLGDVCAYDITNSYRSIFMVHDNPIENITGQVIKGFEGVMTAEDGFLVPYLYPCAKKLLIAAQAAEADGYRLRIYEAFRPNEATRYLYDTTLAQLDYPVPVIDGESGGYIFYEPPEPGEGNTQTAQAEELALTSWEDIEPEPQLPEEEDNSETAPAEDGPQVPEEDPPQPADEPAPPPEEPTQPAEEPAQPTEADESGLQEEPAPEEETEPSGIPEDSPFYGHPTFREVMTDGRFGIGSFLAAVVSAHNRGIALDLTIEKLDGTRLSMQSPMHDLSWYSATYLNNSNAKLLESYMTMPGVAMRGLTSEWWHFQDDDTREAINLSSYLTKGVTAEGWTRDNIGWRYRDAKGVYARDTTIKVDGKQYTFDAAGYAVE
ncbi:MAG: hypothetical protein HDT20_06720 [Oscillibacter sp.]|nr:hypothetical protein [Oscillibacter sp.]